MNKASLLGLSALLLLVAGPAFAGYPNGIDSTVAVCGPRTPTGCFTPTLLPVPSSFQGKVSMASATGLTVPSGALEAVITFEGTNDANGFCANWEDDGGTPTVSDGGGNPIASGQVMTYKVVDLTKILMIARTATSCTFTASYYK